MACGHSRIQAIQSDGWNYSGKTTLSRAFRCFEQKQMHEDFVNAQVQLKAEDGTVYSLSAPQSTPVFRVFNSDFVRDNLEFGSGSASPILVLGADDIAKQGELKEKKEQRDKITSSRVSNDGKRNTIISDIERAFTNYARDFIKIPLSEVSYDKRRFEPKVNFCKKDYEKYIQDDESLRECLLVYRSTDKKFQLSEEMISLSSVEELSTKTRSLLDRVVTANNPIQRLRDNPIIEAWVNEGRPLHDGKTSCQFCDRPLPEDLMKHLVGHFSEDYENLMTELNSLERLIGSAQNEDATLANSKADFYPEYGEKFIAEKLKIERLIDVRKSALGALASALQDKKTKVFTKIEGPKVVDPMMEIELSIKEINRIISSHNYRSVQFERNRQEAFSKIEMHYAASFVRDQRYNESLNEILSLDNLIEQEGSMLRALSLEIHALEKGLSEASKGADRINELLAAYFGKNDLCIAVSSDGKFQIARGGVIAKNLSEGEKTAIAFAYFITRVQDGRHPLEDTRIVIDDPISSLDANHLFNTYALIKTQLIDCRQLFISTHSFEFYNLIRDWAADDENTKKPQAEWKKWAVFLVRRTDSGKSILEEIPKELLKFKSEYHYLFSTLFRFENSGAGDFDTLLSLPNVVRRFMEAFGGIMIPVTMGLKGKMDRIFPDSVMRERVWKFINYYSHQNTLTRSLTIPDTSECKAIVQACLKAVRDWDIDYFNDLKTEVS